MLFKLVSIILLIMLNLSVSWSEDSKTYSGVVVFSPSSEQMDVLEADLLKIIPQGMEITNIQKDKYCDSPFIMVEYLSEDQAQVYEFQRKINKMRMQYQ